MTYDCFQFFNELDVLECRLATLEKVVDHFILIESPWTHSGYSKPLHYELNKDRFERWNSKITHLVHTEFRQDDSPWDRDHAQREAGMAVLADIKTTDVVGIFDVDEIPRPRAYDIKPYDCVAVCLTQFRYRFNLTYPGPIPTHPKIIRGDVFKTKSIKRHRWEMEFRGIRHDGGWHFSYMGDEKAYLEKAMAFSHCNDPEVLEKIRDVSNGMPLRAIDEDAPGALDSLYVLPKWVNDNKDELVRKGLL